MFVRDLVELLSETSQSVMSARENQLVSLEPVRAKLAGWRKFMVEMTSKARQTERNEEEITSHRY